MYKISNFLIHSKPNMIYEYTHWSNYSIICITFFRKATKYNKRNMCRKIPKKKIIRIGTEKNYHLKKIAKVENKL